MTERTWTKNKRWWEYANTSLPEFCIGIKMSMNGAADPFEDDDELVDACNYILARIVEWQSSCIAAERQFDNSVKEICKETLKIVKYYRPDLPIPLYE